MLRPGRHGGMTATELEGIILRNADFLWVHRAGSGDLNNSTGGLYRAVSGQFLMGIGGGWLPEYSRMMNLKWGCACTPEGYCRTAAHGTKLKRGWRNILYETLARHYTRSTREMRSVLGDEWVRKAETGGLAYAPMENPEPAWNHSQLQTAV